MNIKFLYFLATLLLVSLKVLPNELVIEVTTDKYPAETSWKLFDTDFNLIQQNGTLEKNTVHRDTILLDEASCYYWTIYDSYGDGMSNSSAPGDFKLFFNGELFNQCTNPNFGDSISVYGIGTQCALSDASVTALTFNKTQAFNPFLLSFSLTNFGSEVIQSLTFWYDVDGRESEYITLDNLNIVFGQTVELSLPEHLQFTTSGSISIGLHLIKVNGEADENTNNNFLSKTIEVLDGYWKKPMHEVFTSSTCSPCAIANPIIDGTLAKYPNQYALIKYQVNWPSSGDPYYTSEVGYMVGLYGVNAAPTFYVDAYATDVNYLPANFEENSGGLTPIYIELQGLLVGDSIFAQAKVTTQTAMGATAYLRVAVVEKTTIDNVSSNGEEEFNHVFMKFISDKAGSLIGQLPAGGSTILNFSNSLSKTNVEELNDLTLVAYVFYNNAYRILQSEMHDLPYTPAPPYLSANIANGASNVDTLPEIVISSTAALYNTDGSAINDLNSKIKFTGFDTPDMPLAINATLASDAKSIRIVPQKSLELESNYSIALNGIASKEGVVADSFKLTFKTIGGLKINQSAILATPIYPNPFKAHLNVNLIHDAQLTISDLTGTIVFQQTKPKGNTSIELSELKQGIYLLRVSQMNGQQVIKLFKQ
jgi:hypothetical protein